MELSGAADSKRYSRQTILSEVGIEGQEALGRARVLCVGAGGLGSPVLLYLAAAGVGMLGVIDGDRVDVSNLQRQILLKEADVGQLKSETAIAHLKSQNSGIILQAYPFDLTSQNAIEILSQYDVVVDCTDNFTCKFLINDACAKLGIPWVYGSVNQWEGQVCSFFAQAGPCYRCLYPHPPTAKIANCAESGVMGASVGIVGSWQACHVLSILLPTVQKKWGNLQVIHSLTLEQMTLAVSRRKDCATCGVSPSEIVLSQTLELKCEIKSNSTCLVSSGDVHALPENYFLLDVRTQKEWDEKHISQAHHWELSRLESGSFPTQWILDAQKSQKQLVLYCQSGKRSALAAQILKDAGYDEIAELEGGILSWPFV